MYVTYNVGFRFSGGIKGKHREVMESWVSKKPALTLVIKL